MRPRRSRAWVVDGSPGVRCSTRRAWCSAALASHSVVAIEVAKAPAEMRRKLFSPDAAAIWCCGRSPSARPTSGREKHDTAAPCRVGGKTRGQKPTSELKRERIQAKTGKKTGGAG